MPETNSEQRAAEILGLLELADFLKAHPGVPMPVLSGINAFVYTRDELVAVARLANWRKVYNDVWFTLSREFSGGISLDVNVARSTLCRKVVTGKRIEPATPAREVETYEWICDDASLLQQPESAVRS